MLHVAVAQFEIKHGAKRVSSVSGKSTCIEIYFTDQVGIKDSHRTAGCSLRAEVIDIGYFHSVQIETVFRRRTTAYNQVIAVAERRQLPDKTEQYAKCPGWLPDSFLFPAIR